MERKLTVRIEEEDLALLKEAAWLRKTSLSQWIRSVTLATAKRTIEESKK
jgi:uncharacterized protein (DUF1778 family)